MKMGVKNLFILILVVALVGAVLFGSLGSFLGFISGVATGMSDVVSENEGYVYRGGPVDLAYAGDDYKGSSSDSVGNSGDSSSSKDSGGSLLDALSKDSKSSKDSGSSIVDGSSSGGSSSGGSSSGGSSSSGNSSSGGSPFDGNSSRKIEYKEFQEDYETGLVDVEGNPIYLSIVSTNGGELDPGIYQVYWSKLGPINQTRIG